MIDLPLWLLIPLVAGSVAFWFFAVSILVIAVDSLLRPGGSMWGRWR